MISAGCIRIGVLSAIGAALLGLPLPVGAMASASDAPANVVPRLLPDGQVPPFAAGSGSGASVPAPGGLPGVVVIPPAGGPVYAYGGIATSPTIRQLLTAAGQTTGVGTSPARLGVITGVAQPCVGMVSSAAYRRLVVTVTLSRHARTVARQVVTGAHIYRFHAAAGSYVVSTNEGQGSTPVRVSVRSGKVTRANITSSCR